MFCKLCMQTPDGGERRLHRNVCVCVCVCLPGPYIHTRHASRTCIPNAGFKHQMLAYGEGSLLGICVCGKCHNGCKLEIRYSTCVYMYVVKEIYIYTHTYMSCMFSSSKSHEQPLLNKATFVYLCVCVCVCVFLCLCMCMCLCVLWTL
jgi:hypothetical protein